MECDLGLGYTDKGIVEAASQRAYAEYRRNANISYHPFEISYAEFKKLIFSKCYYCKRPASKNSVLLTASSPPLRRNCIDRVDPALGYTSDNTAASCKSCQALKFGHNLFRLGKIAHIYKRVQAFTRKHKKVKRKHK